LLFLLDGTGIFFVEYFLSIYNDRRFGDKGQSYIIPIYAGYFYSGNGFVVVMDND